MTKRYTPGPWSADQIAMTKDWVITRVCPGNLDKYDRPPFVDNFARLEPPYDCEANARLIAAAPELLEALEALIPHWRGDAKLFDRACDAIAKAKGVKP